MEKPPLITMRERSSAKSATDTSTARLMGYLCLSERRPVNREAVSQSPNLAPGQRHADSSHPVLLSSRLLQEPGRAKGELENRRADVLQRWIRPRQVVPLFAFFAASESA